MSLLGPFVVRKWVDPHVIASFRGKAGGFLSTIFPMACWISFWSKDGKKKQTLTDEEVWDSWRQKDGKMWDGSK